jgi:hypothetical protein
MSEELVDMQIKGQNTNLSDNLSAQSVEGQLATAKMTEKSLRRELDEITDELQASKTQLMLKENELKKVKSKAS